jgi:Pro-kumamolisin, activation domain
MISCLERTMFIPISKASKFGPALIAMMAAVVFVALAVGIGFGPSARAQTSAAPARPMITQSIVEANLVRLFGNVRPEAIAANDRGRVPDGFSMEHLLLQLKRPPAQEQALGQLIDQLHDPASPNFHRWLLPNQFGVQFGPAASDIQQVTGWLQRRGFSVNVVYPSGMTIDFSGNAGQVFAAFHTEIHYLQARGATHFANMTDPQIPAALASAVAGIVSLNDFMPRAVVRKPKAESGKNNCTAPGVNADDGEAILDAEYASAAAPSAAIVMATCKSSFTTFGGLIAIQNLIQRGEPARHHQPELRRVRGVLRRFRQCGLQCDLSAGRRGGNLDLQSGKVVSTSESYTFTLSANTTLVADFK